MCVKMKELDAAFVGGQRYFCNFWDQIIFCEFNFFMYFCINITKLNNSSIFIEE